MKGVGRELRANSGHDELENQSAKMSFLEHLDELRKRILRIVLYIGIGFAASFYFSKIIYRFLSAPITRLLPDQKMAFTNLPDPFTLYMKVALLAGIFLTVPFTLYEVWKFVAPGLYRKEKRYVVPFMFSSVILFIGGGAFCYYYVLPAAYGWLLNLGADFTPVIKIDEYMSLTNMMLLGFGLIFQMPVLVAFLSIFGMVTARFLWTKFKYAMILIVALAALLSPTGDAFNLIIWTLPMVVLYFLSIGIAAIFGWRRKKAGLA